MVRILWVFAVVGLLVMAGCRSEPVVEVADDYQEILLAHPELLIQVSSTSATFESGNLEPGPEWEDLGAELIDQRLEVLFDRGYGDEFFILKQALIPVMVAVALAANDGFHGDIPSTIWLGHIDGRIERAMVATGYEQPEEVPDAERIKAVTAGLVELAARSMEAPVETVDVDIIVDSVTNPEAVVLSGGDLEKSVLWRATVVTALVEAGRVDIPTDMTHVEVVSGGEFTTRHWPILGRTGEPFTFNDQPVDLADWLGPFSDYFIGFREGVSPK